jgi:hypothetical protein
MYLLFLDENFAEQEKYDWHLAQKKALNDLKEEKQLISEQPQLLPKGADPATVTMTEEITKKMQEEIEEALNRGAAALERGIDISNFIKVQLEKQITKLDEVYVQNRDFEVRMNRAKEGLLVILRQAFTNKLTRFCAMLLVVAIVGVVVVVILRSNGTIA